MAACANTTEEPVAPTEPSAPALVGVVRDVSSMPSAIEEVAANGSSQRARMARLFPYPYPTVDRENYTHFDDNAVKRPAEDPVSTFSIDVDTAAYTNVRRFLNQGILPRHDAVRVEELVNYFHYPYAPPSNDTHPFAVHTEIGPSPWHRDRLLLHIGIKGYETSNADLPPANLVFLVDVSGSMHSPSKLPLLKASLKLLTKKLRAEDTLAIAVYAGAAGQILESTPGDRKAKILAALDQLSAGGPTNGGQGIRLAYSIAQTNFKAGGINRVILATDGDFNVGTVSQDALKELVEEKRASGVSLSILGYGTGNYNDALMQELAQIGDGNAAYIDTLNEARKVLIDEMASTLLTIARDVKIQVEFNPAAVAEYRLIGYETRHLDREDFNNDRVDAGDIGAGHTVTAIYEISLTGSKGALIDPLRYRQPQTQFESSESLKPANASELAFLRLRYKTPGTETSVLQEFAIRRADITSDLADTSGAFRFSGAVAAFGQILRGADYTGSFDFAAVIDLANAAKGQDPFGYRGEIVNLVRTADALATPEVARVD